MGKLATKAEMKSRILQVMKRLNVLGKVRSDTANGRIYYSERQNSVFNAVLYWLENEPELVAKKAEIEAKQPNMAVFHAIKTPTVYGDMVDFLLLSKDKDEWEREDADLAEGYAFSYCLSPMGSEYGTIGIKPSMGGLTRTA